MAEPTTRVGYPARRRTRRVMRREPPLASRRLRPRRPEVREAHLGRGRRRTARFQRAHGATRHCLALHRIGLGGRLHADPFLGRSDESGRAGRVALTGDPGGSSRLRPAAPARGCRARSSSPLWNIYLAGWATTAPRVRGGPFVRAIAGPHLEQACRKAARPVGSRSTLAQRRRCRHVRPARTATALRRHERVPATTGLHSARFRASQRIRARPRRPSDPTSASRCRAAALAQPALAALLHA